MMKTDSRYLFSEMWGPHETQPSSASMSEFGGSVRISFHSFKFQLHLLLIVRVTNHRYL